MIVINIIRGFFMALADSVPGVSGGTIAFIMGFYDDFIHALNTIVSRTIKLKDKKESLKFLGKIGIGWVFGMGISVFILSSIFEQEIYKISSLFIGFILFSIPLIINEEKANLKNKYKNIIFTLIGILIVGLITFYNPISSQSALNLSFDHFTFWLGLYVFVAGMIAISAMVLPGISGSTILLILGLYASIIMTIKDVMSFNFNHLYILVIFGLGILTGIISIIRLLKHLLTKYRSQMIYFILGLMIGSLYAVFMGPTTLETKEEAMTFETFEIIYFLIGGVIIFSLDEFKKRLKS